jgi:hypothetical protein
MSGTSIHGFALAWWIVAAAASASVFVLVMPLPASLTRYTRYATVP